MSEASTKPLDQTTAGDPSDYDIPSADGPSTAHAPETPVPERGPSAAGGKRPISERKLAANRANAQRSTGPRTFEGKQKSKQNATTHGFTARYLAPPNAGTPEREEFEAVRTDLWSYYRPEGALERLLVEKLVIEYMRYLRIVERERTLTASAPGFFAELVSKLARYQTAVNNQLFQAIRELERVQALRRVDGVNAGAGEEQEESGEGCVLPNEANRQ